MKNKVYVNGTPTFQIPQEIVKMNVSALSLAHLQNNV